MTMQQDVTTKCDDDRRKRRGLFRARIAAVIAGSVGALLLGGGVFAAWNPTASLSSGSYGAANLAVQMVDANGTTFNTGVSNMLPGDFLYRYADLTNSGSVSQTFSGTVSGTGLLSPAMTVQVDLCSVSWSSNASCSGTVTSITSESALTAPVSMSFPSQVPNAVGHARFRYKLVDSASQTLYQGKSGGVQVSLAGSSTVAGGQDRTAG